MDYRTRNHEVKRKQDLLDSAGEIAEPGWARSQVWQYDRSQIKAKSLRIKEWDYYLVLGDGFGAAFTLSDDGYIGLQSLSLLILDSNKPWEHTETVLDFMPLGKMKMPATSSSGDIVYRNEKKGVRMEFWVRDLGGGHIRRRILANWKSFYEGKPLTCDITLDQPPMDSLVIATPWDKKHCFYYNQKINCLTASGQIQFGGRTFEFDPARHFGTLDWGRGVWTYDNTWYWGSGNGMAGGKPFGFNIGYGFGNTSAASENVVFYDGVASKIDDVEFQIPEDSYLDPWKITSSDHRFEMTFEPVLDRSALLDVKLISSDQHQVFGRMSGTAVLDDGSQLRIQDLMCFCEKVHNKY